MRLERLDLSLYFGCRNFRYAVVYINWVHEYTCVVVFPHNLHNFQHAMGKGCMKIRVHIIHVNSYSTITAVVSHDDLDVGHL